MVSSRPAALREMIRYDESWLVFMLFKMEGSVALRASMYALPAALVCFAILLYEDMYDANFQKSMRIETLNNSVLWSACSGMMIVLLGFRTNRSMSRFWEGTGLLHQMRGEWFDSISCLATFSRMSLQDRPNEVYKFRHTLVRLMSLCHGTALAEIAGADADAVATIDSTGLNDETLFYLQDCRDKFHFNRVEVLVHLIQTIIVGHIENGIIKIPPPILSRVFQTLSRGFVNLLNAKKIADTRFPFPYAQTIAFLLLLQLAWTPICMASLVKDVVWAPILTFIPIFAFFSINFIGMQLENPFGDEPNDLPLDHFQHEMNSCLLMLLQEGSDHMPSLEDDRYEGFDSLVEAFHKDRVDGAPKQTRGLLARLGSPSALSSSSKSSKDLDLEVGSVDDRLSRRLSQVTKRRMSELKRSHAREAEPKKEKPSSMHAKAPSEANPRKEEAKSSSSAPAEKAPLPAEPSASSAAAVNVNVSLEPLAAARLQDFRGALENWTCSIERQLVDLKGAFTSVNSLASAGSVSAAHSSPSSMQPDAANLVMQDLQSKDTRPMLLQLANGIDKSLEQWQVMFERQAMELSRTFAELTVFTRSIAMTTPLVSEGTAGSLHLGTFDREIDVFLEQGS